MISIPPRRQTSSPWSRRLGETAAGRQWRSCHVPAGMASHLPVYRNQSPAWVIPTGMGR